MSWRFSALVIAVCLTSIVASAYVSQKSNYYGRDFLAQVQSGQLQNADLLDKLFHIVSDAHIKTKDAEDVLAPNCETTKLASNQNCIQHHALGYDLARKLMFGSMHLEKQGETYVVKDVYCEKYFSNADFGESGNIGPGLIPSNGSILNTEHTWPQSRFTSRFNTEMQKSDIHHLYPTDSQMNSARSSLRFGEVEKDMEKLKCSQNRLGRQTGTSGAVYQPPVAHRGNVARAIFYFATRYQMKISDIEEATLKKWNHEDPVDDAEILRNNQIEDAQGNRNPYIDYPELADRVETFTFNTKK